MRTPRSALVALAAASCAGEPARAPDAPAPSEPLARAEAGHADPELPDAGFDANGEADATVDLDSGRAGAPRDWPTDIPWVEGMRLNAEGSTPLVTQLELELDASTRDGERWLAAWSEAAKQKGYDVQLNQKEGYATLSKDGSKATLLVGQPRGGWLSARFARAAHPPAKLRGPCVPIPERSFAFNVHSAGVDQSGEHLRSDRSWKLATVHWADVDADGELDAFVPNGRPKRKCPWELTYTLYVVRGACGHRVGEVGPGFLVQSSAEKAPDASGFRTLMFQSSWARPGKSFVPLHQTRTVEAAFEAGRYRKTRDDTRGGECHHCAIASCVAEP